MYQREQVLFTIMLPMVKGHVIKYHKKPSPHPSLAPESTLNDRPPRLHRTLWSPHNNPITSGSCDDPPILQGHDPSSEMGAKSHTTITVSTKGASTCQLMRQLLIRQFRHAGIM
ncbi:hypothetical protein AVEN_222054-1 [Araneus ventricosus]|uniref:Uncharacterized protein n=1 Tax=Araneus ventricosus TaxID=182803 RepID=A0A4Y2P9T3_ARAVE|nr:hypothetical protein AVEN_222054-1 [Araneus ventricosus]